MNCECTRYVGVVDQYCMSMTMSTCMSNIPISISTYIMAMATCMSMSMSRITKSSGISHDHSFIMVYLNVHIFFMITYLRPSVDNMNYDCK